MPAANARPRRARGRHESTAALDEKRWRIMAGESQENVEWCAGYARQTIAVISRLSRGLRSRDRRHGLGLGLRRAGLRSRVRRPRRRPDFLAPVASGVGERGFAYGEFIDAASMSSSSRPSETRGGRAGSSSSGTLRQVWTITRRQGRACAVLPHRGEALEAVGCRTRHYWWTHVGTAVTHHGSAQDQRYQRPRCYGSLILPPSQAIRHRRSARASVRRPTLTRASYRRVDDERTCGAERAQERATRREGR